MANKNAALVLKEDTLNDEFVVWDDVLKKNQIDSKTSFFEYSKELESEEDENVQNLIDYTESHPFENQCKFPILEASKKIFYRLNVKIFFRS